MAENTSVKAETTFLTTGGKPRILVTGSKGRKTTYPTDRHTTASHEAAVIKWATKNVGRGATVTRVKDGPMGDKYVITFTPAPDTETAPVATEA